MRSFSSANFHGGRDVEKELLRLHRRFMSNSRRHDRAVFVRRWLPRAIMMSIGASAAAIICDGLSNLFPGLPGLAVQYVAQLVS